MTRPRSLRLSTPAIIALSACWLALLFIPPPARAQAPVAPTTEAEAQLLTAIPVAEIALQADALDARLQNLEASIAAVDLEERIEKELGEVEKGIESAQVRLDRILARSHSATELEMLRTRWENMRRRLDAQTQQLGQQGIQLEAWRSEIREETERWRLTRSQARSASAPETVVNRVIETVRTLLSAETATKARLDATLDLQSRIAGQQRLITPAITRIEEGQREHAASFFVRQNAPLWSARFSAKDARAEFAAIVSTLSEMGANLWTYVRLHLGRVIAQVLFILAVGSSLSRARAMPRRRAATEAQPPDAERVDALGRPWATALLFGLFLTRGFHPERVLGLQAVAALVALPAWLRAFGAMLPAALRPPLVGLAVLALSEIFRFALVGFDLATRNLLPLNLAAGLAGVYWLRRPERLRHIPVQLGRGLWFRFLGGWLRLAELAFAAGLVAAVLGYTNLADRIAFGAIWGSVFGAGYLAVVLTAEAVLEAVVDAGWLDPLRMVRAHRQRFVEVVRRGLRLLGLFAWLQMLLQASQIWDPFREVLGILLGARLGYGPVTFSIGSVLAFGVTLYVSWLLARFLSFTLDQEVFSRVRMPPGVPFALTTFTRYTVLVGGFVAALSILGFSWNRLSLLIGALGVGIGFGLQNVVNNFVSGIILLFERPVRVGDRVQLDDLVGVVSTIGLRASRVRTFDGSDVMVPNSEFISGRVTNWTLSDQRRRAILPVRVAYGTKPAHVLEILEQVAQRSPDVLDEPAPEALFRAFGPSSLDFELRAWTESERGYLNVLSDLAVATEEALEAAGIQIPFPQHDLHLRNVPELGEAIQDAIRASRSSGSDESSS